MEKMGSDTDSERTFMLELELEVEGDASKVKPLSTSLGS